MGSVLLLALIMSWSKETQRYGNFSIHVEPEKTKVKRKTILKKFNLIMSPKMTRVLTFGLLCKNWSKTKQTYVANGGNNQSKFLHIFITTKLKNKIF